MNIDIQYLHQAFGSFEEVLATLRLRALLMPVDDRLIRHAILVIQDLQRVTMGSEHLTPDLASMSWHQRTFKICGNAFMIRVSS